MRIVITSNLKLSGRHEKYIEEGKMCYNILKCSLDVNNLGLGLYSAYCKVIN